MSKTLLKKSALFISIIFSISILFSCASKPKDEAVTETEVSEPEETAPAETEDSADSSEITEAAEEAEVTESNDTTENTEEENEVQSVEPELEEIPDPVVYEAELPPLPKTNISDSEPDTVSEEKTETPVPVKEEEIQTLPELPEATVTVTEPESAPENKETEDLQNIDSDDSENTETPDSYDATDIFADTDEVEDIETDGENEAQVTEEPEEKTPEIIPSRSVSMNNGQSLDIEYPGKGWVYLGCTDGTKSLTSTGRRITGAKNTVFTLVAKIPGTVILHFYKEDLLADKYIDDYLEVTVSEIKSKASFHVKAPAYSEAVPKKPEPAAETKTETVVAEPAKQETVKQETVKTEKVSSEPAGTETVSPVTKTAEPEVSTVTKVTKIQRKTEVQKTEPVETKPQEKPVLLNPEEYLEAARKALDDKRWTDCYNNLQLFLETTDRNKDEGYFLLGKLYETASDFRNIKKSIEAYKEITDGYPLSKFYDEAEKRIIYLQRFYINIR